MDFRSQMDATPLPPLAAITLILQKVRLDSRGLLSEVQESTPESTRKPVA